MGFDTRTLPAYFNTDADLQAWVAGIRASLEAAGLTRTTDTGQINPATVTKAASDRGYDIYRFNDTEQASFPIFMKLTYSPPTTTRPGLKVQFGTGTDGGGNLTGQVSGQRSIAPGSEKSAGVTCIHYSSVSSHGVRFINNLDQGNTGFGYGCVFERLRGLDGSVNTDGCAWLTHDTNTFMRFGLFVRTGTQPGELTRWPGIQSDGGLRAWGADLCLMPMLFALGKPMTIECLIYALADLAEGVPVSVNHLGVTQNFMPLGDGFGSSGITAQSAGGYGLAIPWS